MYHSTAKGLAALGRNGDSTLMHVNPTEVAALSKILGPVSTNPQTGLPEASNWNMVLGTLGGLATGVGGLGLGAAVAGPAEEALTSTLGEGLITDFLSKAAPVAAGAGLGAMVGGATGGKYGALGGALQGGLSGGLGGLEAGNILGTADTGAGSVELPDGGAPNAVNMAAEKADLQNQAMQNITAGGSASPQQTAGVLDNLGKYANRFSSWNSLKGLTKDYGGPLFMSGMLGQGVAGMGSSTDAYNRMKQRERMNELEQQRAADEAYQRIYGGQGIGVNYADGGPVHFSLPGPVPVSMTIPESAIDQIHAAGGIGNLVQQHMANGGYVNTQPFNPQQFYPQSRIASAQPYAAAAPTSVLDTLHEGASFAGGGFIEGDGDGMSDDIDADIEGEEPVRIADGEFVFPRHLVDRVGGPERLDELLKEIRRRAYGTEEQINQDAAKQAAMDMLGEE